MTDSDPPWGIKSTCNQLDSFPLEQFLLPAVAMQQEKPPQGCQAKVVMRDSLQLLSIFEQSHQMAFEARERPCGAAYSPIHIEMDTHREETF